MPAKKIDSFDPRNALALALIPNIGDGTAKNLVSYCGGIDAVFKESYNALSKIPGIGSVRAKSVKSFKDWAKVDKELLFIDTYDIELLTYLDKGYPNRLKAHDDCPIILFKRGDADLNAQKIISTVGTRNATNYARDFINKLSEDLKLYQVSVTSGLAHGVDALAHKAALKQNLPTIAVLGHGFNTIYPAIHKNLAEEIAYGNGALLTEYFSDTPGNAENFPQRNRIVAALCDALIVVESAYKGGSMITAEIAHSYDKMVFAVPGNVKNKNSQGCNMLIKLNNANLIENIGDLIYHLNWDAKELDKAFKQTELFANLSPEEEKVVKVLEKGELSIDNLFYECKIPMTKLSLILLDLELKNKVKTKPGKVYAVV